MQKLDDPPDVVLTLNGKPVRGTKTKSAEDETDGAGDPDRAAAGRAENQVTVLVNAPRNLWIQGNDINTEIGLSDGFRIEYATEPRCSAT